MTYTLTGESVQWLFNVFIICYWCYYPALALFIAAVMPRRCYPRSC